MVALLYENVWKSIFFLLHRHLLFSCFQQLCNSVMSKDYALNSILGQKEIKLLLFSNEIKKSVIDSLII